MSSNSISHNGLADSTATLPSDSENYSPSTHSEPSNLNPSSSPSPSTSSDSPVILYKPPTFWSLLRGAAINLILPFVNGLMLGFGELFAHEAAFRLGWSRTKVCEYSVSIRRNIGIGPICMRGSRFCNISPAIAKCRGIPAVRAC